MTTITPFRIPHSRTFRPPRHLARHTARLGVSALAAAILAAALAVTSAAVPAHAAAADANAQWDVATVDGPIGADRENFDYLIEPGDRVADAVVVTNTGSDPIDLELYAADGFTTEAGQFDLRTTSHTSTGVGAWLELERDRISLDAGESAEIPFTIAVPDDAHGEYLGGIVTSAAGSNGAEVERRAAVRVRLQAGQAVEPSLAIDDVRLDFAGGLFGTGRATVTYTIRNTGDTALAAEQSVALAGPFDAFPVAADPVENVPNLLPGESWTLSVPVDGVTPSGPITASITVVPLLNDRAGSTGPLATINGTGIGWGIPWLPLVLVIGVGVLAVVVLVRGARHRAMRRTDQTIGAEGGT